MSMVLTLLGSMYFMWRIDATLALLAVAAIPSLPRHQVLGRKVRPLATALNEAHWQRSPRGRKSWPDHDHQGVQSPTAGGGALCSDERDDPIARRSRVVAFRRFISGGAVARGVAVLIVLWLAADRVAAQSLGAGALVTFLLYASLMTRPVSALADLYGQTQSVRRSAHARGSNAGGSARGGE